MYSTAKGVTARAVKLTTNGVELDADLALPPDPSGLVLFAHGSGSSRHSSRNRAVAAELQRAGLATLLLDLLTVDEEAVDRNTAQLRFDIPLLASRLIAAAGWASSAEETHALPIGFFGASTGAAAALVAAAQLGTLVHAVVSRGGRPDLAGRALGLVRAPTLLIVGGFDPLVLDLNREALLMLRGEKRLEIVPGASHLFEERGALERVALLATRWFERYLPQHVVTSG